MDAMWIFGRWSELLRGEELGGGGRWLVAVASRYEDDDASRGGEGLVSSDWGGGG